MSKLNLLPRGYFEITLEDSTIIKGRIGTWSQQRFCNRVGVITITDMLKMFSETLSIPVMAQFLLACVEYDYRGKEFPFKEEDAYEWIDELGGYKGADILKLITLSISNDTEEAVEQEKKTVIPET